MKIVLLVLLLLVGCSTNQVKYLEMTPVQGGGICLDPENAYKLKWYLSE